MGFRVVKPRKDEQGRPVDKHGQPIKNERLRLVVNTYTNEIQMVCTCFSSMADFYAWADGQELYLWNGGTFTTEKGNTYQYYYMSGNQFAELAATCADDLADYDFIIKL